jgi:hypothetical protein
MVSPAIGEHAVIEAHRLRQVNARLLFALQVARAALESALVDPLERREFCPRCEQVVRLTDDGEACAQCKLVL